MPTVADLQIKYSADTSSAEAGTSKVQGLISGLSSGAKGLATVAGGFLLANAVQNVIGGVGQLAGAGLNFEQQMANVNSVLQDDGAVKKYGDALIALSSDPRVLAGPTELAAGFYNVASAGFTGQGALDVMTAAAMAATAGMTTADVAAQAISGTMNAYGQETYTAQQVSDALFGAVAAGSLTFEQLANNLGNTTSLASQMGVSVNELATAYAVMSNNNISAAQAETQISAVMRSAANPTTELTAAVQAHGYATAEAAIAAEGFGGFIDLVTEASGGSKEALYDMLGTQEAVNAALVLGADEGSAFADILDDITQGAKDGTTTQKALEKQMDSARFKMAEARKQVEIVATLLGGMLAPAIGKAAAAFSSFISGPLTSLGRYLGAVMSDGDLMNDWLTHLPGFIQPVAKAFGGLVLAGQDVIDAFQDLRRGDIGGFFDELQEAASTAWSAISELANTTLDWVLDTGIPTVTGWIVDNAGDIWNGIKNLVGWAWDGLADLGLWSLNVGIPSVVGAITGIAGRLGDWLRSYIYGGGIVGDGTGGPEPGPGGGIMVDIAQITLNVLDAVANIQASDVQGWIQDRLDEIGTVQAEVHEWQIIIEGDPEVQGDPGGKSESSLRRALEGFVFGIPILGWAIQTTKNPDIVGDPLKQANDALQTLVRGRDIIIDDVKWLMRMANPSVVIPALIDTIKDKIPPISISGVKWLLGLAIPDINLPSGDAIKAALRVAGEAAGIPDFILDRLVGDASPTPAMDWGKPFGDAPRSGQGSEVGSVNVGGSPVTTLPNTGAGPGSGAAATIAAQARAAAQQVAAAMTQLAASVRSGVAQATAALTPMGAAFTATGARVTAATTQMSAQVRAQVTAMVAQARAQFTAFQASTAATMTAIQASTTATVTALVAQVTAQFAQMTAQATAQANQMRGSVQAAMQGMAAAGQSAMSQFASAVQSGFSQAAAAAQSGVNAIRGAVNSIGSLYGQGFSIGSSFGQGVAAGLYSMLGAVQAAASAIVAAAAQAAAAKAQIASPSRLMRDQIGVPLAQGVIVGLDSQRNNVASAFANMIPVDARLGRGFTPSSGMGRSANHAPVQNITIYALKSDEYARLLRQAERGNTAYDQIGGRARETALGPSRRV